MVAKFQQGMTFVEVVAKKKSRSNLPFWSLSEVIVPNFENSRPNFQYFERSENVKTFKSFSLKI